MSRHVAEAIVRRWIEEGWDQGRLDVVADLLLPTVTLHERSAPARTAPRDEVRRLVHVIRTLCPRFRFIIEDVVADGDRVAVRWQIRCPQESGPDAVVTGFAFYRVEDGRIAEIWSDLSASELMRAIGVVSESPWHEVWSRMSPLEKRRAFVTICQEMVQALERAPL